MAEREFGEIDMSQPLRVLILEDRPADAELMAHELRRAGFDPEWTRVETEADYVACLDPSPQVILSDYTLPGFDARRALEHVQQRGLDIPFIVVTGTVSEEAAVECMKQGAADYLLKDRLARLGQAVIHALAEQQIRQEKQRAEEALRESEARFRRLAENAQDIIARYELRPERGFSYMSPAVTRVLGYTPEDYYADPDFSLKVRHPEDLPAAQALFSGQALEPLSVVRVRHKEGHTVWLESHRVPFYDEAGNLMAFETVARDATERKRAEERDKRHLAQLAALHTIDIAITSTMDLRVSLNVLLDQVISQLEIDAVGVLLLNPHTLLLEYAAGRGFKTRTMENVPLRIGEGYAGRAAMERRLVQVPHLATATPPFVRHALVTEEAFVSYRAFPLVAKGQVKGVLEVFHRAPFNPDAEWLDFLETLAGQAAIAIDNAHLFDSLQRANTELTLAYDATLEGWVRALDMRDDETEGHSQRVVEIAVRLARTMGVGEAELAHVRRGALLHDIGKMAIPDEILHKPGPLTEEEWAVMRQHPLHGYQFLDGIPYLRPALDIPYCHHEKWDGTGYPRRLKGEDIPLSARIFAVVDIWDALRSDRPYRSAWPREQARDYIREVAGAHLDPKVAETFLAFEL